MRNLRASITLALALAPLTAAAQTTSAVQPPAAQTPASPQAWTGNFDVGVRGTTVDGDGARYERYRDLGDGGFLERIRTSRQHNGWQLAFGADHVARDDQRYTASAERTGKMTAWFLWDQIPMLLSRTTQTLYSGIGTGTLVIADGIQTAVQAAPAAITPLFNQFATEFETKTLRKIAEGGVNVQASPDLRLSARLRYTSREGTIPYGGSFGHSSLVEMPAPTDYHFTNTDAGAEFSRNRLLLRAAYTGSFFQNDVRTVEFDNPFRAVDAAATPSRGRLSLAPSSSFMGVNALASVSMPHRTRATAYVSTGFLTDSGDPIMPQTINTAIVTQPLARTTVDGQARTNAVTLTFTSRPTHLLDFSAAYRQYDYDNQTPEFAMRERVSYDNTPAAVNPAVFTEPFGVKRHTLDGDVRLTPGHGFSVGAGASRLEEERTHRIFESTTDNVLRLSFDATGNKWVTLRSKYEHGNKRGTGIEEGEAELASIGEQPGMRHFDVAQRDRDRVTFIGSLTPAPSIGLNLSVAAGTDDYHESEFGLRDNTHRILGLGFDAAPGDRVVFGTSYSFERYYALSRSRQANPGVQFTDPSRNWATDATDRAHTFMLRTDISRIAGKVDVHVAYDFSRARAIYDYITGPVADRTLPEEVIVPSTLPPPSELPPTLSELQRGTLDATYPLGKHVSIGLSYWWEQYKVEDFTLDAEANPELARGQALLMGYLYRPYVANTVWGRLIYRW